MDGLDKMEYLRAHLGDTTLLDELLSAISMDVLDENADWIARSYDIEFQAAED